MFLYLVTAFCNKSIVFNLFIIMIIMKLILTIICCKSFGRVFLKMVTFVVQRYLVLINFFYRSFVLVYFAVLCQAYEQASSSFFWQPLRWLFGLVKKFLLFFDKSTIQNCASFFPLPQSSPKLRHHTNILTKYSIFLGLVKISTAKNILNVYKHSSLTNCWYWNQGL